METNNLGLLISVEGLDGSGKSTQIKLIKEYLESINKRVIVLREPGGTKIGEKVRDILLDKNNTEMDNVAEMLLYASSRAQLFSQVIKPSLESGIIVICDRFIDSSIVYQGYGRGLDIESVLNVNLTAIQNRLPDLTLFIDIEPKTSLNRRFNASETDRLENEAISFHEKAYNGYMQLCKRFSKRIVKINGNRNKMDISKNMINEITNVLKRSKI